MENTALKTRWGNELGKRKFPDKLEMVFESSQRHPTILNFRPDYFTSQEMINFRKGKQTVKTSIGSYKKVKDTPDMVCFDKGRIIGKLLFYNLTN